MSRLTGGRFRPGSTIAGVGADEGDADHVGRAGPAERDAGDADDAASGLGDAVLEGEAAGTSRRHR